MERTTSVLIAILVIATLTTTAEARQWRVKRKRLEAEYVGVNNGMVLVRLKNQRIREIPVTDLSADDVQFVNGMLAFVQQMQGAGRAGGGQQQANGGGQGAGDGRVTELLERSLRVQTAHYQSQWYDLWIVQFARSNGSLYWVAVPARDSYSATEFAVSRDPYSEILFVKRLNRK